MSTVNFDLPERTPEVVTENADVEDVERGSVWCFTTPDGERAAKCGDIVVTDVDREENKVTFKTMTAGRWHTAVWSSREKFTKGYALTDTRATF